MVSSILLGPVYRDTADLFMPSVFKTLQKKTKNPVDTQSSSTHFLFTWRRWRQSSSSTETEPTGLKIELVQRNLPQCEPDLVLVLVLLLVLVLVLILVLFLVIILVFILPIHFLVQVLVLVLIQ